MIDWNVVVTLHEQGFDQARQILGGMGELEETTFYNVLVLRVEDTAAFVEKLAGLCAVNPDLLERCFSQVVPCRRTFAFRSPEEFEEKAAGAARELADEIPGSRFHVRMQRRGLKGRLNSREEERLLGAAVMDRLEAGGREVEVDFEDPDAVLAVETVSLRAGLALLTREEMEEHAFLRVD